MIELSDDALLVAAAELLNLLTVLRYPDQSTLWRLGGSPLENAYQALKRAVAAHRPDADLARTRAELASVRDAYTQAQKATEAERAARRVVTEQGHLTELAAALDAHDRAVSGLSKED